MFYLSLRYELCDLFAGIKWSHFNMGNSPVSPPWCFQNLIMLFQNLPKTCEIQVLNTQRQYISFTGLKLSECVSKQCKSIIIFLNILLLEKCILSAYYCSPGSSAAVWDWGRTQRRPTAGPWCFCVCIVPVGTKQILSSSSSGHAHLPSSPSGHPERTVVHSAV